MRIIRFLDTSGNVHLGEWLEENTARKIEGQLFGAFGTTRHVLEIGHILAPFDPVNIIAIGLNYRKHATETGAKFPDYPAIFAKLTSSTTGPFDPIVLPEDAPAEVDFEGELGVVIGRRARTVSEESALNYVFGYTCVNDVSARDCQKRRDVQWTRAKSFDTFCPFGPCVVTDRSVNPNTLRIRSRLNGELMQDSSTSDMIFSISYLVSYLSHQFTLLPGTLITTGTPAGVGCARDPAVFLKSGDQVTVEVDGIGRMCNPVKTASEIAAD
jgi:2-keto-4-pentenoate hydratase/2-oxohepta-3-ene-1,7-dioic acid hydratase in catechol pathway